MPENPTRKRTRIGGGGNHSGATDNNVSASQAGHVETAPQRQRVNFRTVNQVALAKLPAILRRWLPDGRLLGDEWVARNPTRRDRRAGSFKVNVRSGVWADFATKDKGGDAIGLAAYLSGKPETDAALALAKMLGVDHD